VVLKIISLSGKSISHEVLYKNNYILLGEIQIVSDPGGYLMVIETGEHVYIEKVLVGK